MASVAGESETCVRTHAHRPLLRRVIQNPAVIGVMTGTDRRSSDSGGVPRIVQTPDTLGGDPRIEGTRIGVAHVSQRYVEGDETPEGIAAGYDIPVAIDTAVGRRKHRRRVNTCTRRRWPRYRPSRRRSPARNRRPRSCRSCGRNSTQPRATDSRPVRLCRPATRRPRWDHHRRVSRRLAVARLWRAYARCCSAIRLCSIQKQHSRKREPDYRSGCQPHTEHVIALSS